MNKQAAATALQIVGEFLSREWPEAKKAIDVQDWTKALSWVDMMLSAYFHAAGMNEAVLDLSDTDAASRLSSLKRALEQGDPDKIAIWVRYVEQEAIPEWKKILVKYRWQSKWMGKAETLMRMANPILNEAAGMSTAIWKKVSEKYFTAGPEAAQEMLDKINARRNKVAQKFSYEDMVANFSQASLDAKDYFTDGGQAWNGPNFSRVQDYVRKERDEATLDLPVMSGTRVAFNPTLEALLTYPTPPNAKYAGTVVRVRTAHGDMTAVKDLVFVKWDTGSFMPVMRQHLRRASTKNQKTASSYRVVTASLGDLTEFMKVGGASDSLIHKATRDLWSLEKSGGKFVLERLFTESGEPLKV